MGVQGITNSTTGTIEIFPHDFAEIQSSIHNLSLYQALSPQDCINAYAQTFLYDRSDLVVVTETISNPDTVNLTCGTADGHPYHAANGSWFTIDCNSDFTSDDYDLCPAKMPCPTVHDFAECIDHCDFRKDCRASIYAPDYPDTNQTTGTCYLKSNISGRAFSSSHTARKNAAPPHLSTNTSVLWTGVHGWGPQPFDWMCPDIFWTDNFTLPGCRQQALDSSSNWTTIYTPNIRIAKCYSKLVPQRCKLQFSVAVSIIVCLLNLIKLMLFGITFARLRKQTQCLPISESPSTNEHLLMTVGDAMASFLDNPDETTKGICLAEKADFEKGLWNPRWVQTCPIKWTRAQGRRWLLAIGHRRWMVGVLL